MKLDNWLAQRALTCPNRVALVSEGDSITYAELEAEATLVARRLAAHGVRRGSSTVLAMRPSRDYIVLLHALTKLGAVAIPLSPALTAEERRVALEGQGDVVLLDEAATLTRTEADMPLLGEHDMSEPHCRIATSGTAGTPQLIELTFGNHLWSAVGSAFNIGVSPEDVWLCCLPLSHVAGLSIVMRSAIYGTGMRLLQEFDVETVAEALEQGGVTLMSLVPTMLLRLLEAGVDLGRPRAILVGGGPVPQSALEEALAGGASVIQTYGLTEAASQVTTLSPEDAASKVGSAGRPLLTTHLRIAEGEILVQGPTVSPGSIDADGWLHTGDMGRIDEDGFLWVEGRIDDLIVSGGENVSPFEVESVIAEHESVAEVAVVGRDDPEWQQAVTAVVVPSAGAEVDPEELRRHCLERLAGYKVPKRFEFATELPRTRSGKLKRRALR